MIPKIFSNVLMFSNNILNLNIYIYIYIYIEDIMR